MRSLKDLRFEKKRLQELIDSTVIDIHAREERMKTFYSEYRKLEAEESHVMKTMAVEPQKVAAG